RSYTPAVKDLIELIPSDIGRPLSDLHKKFEDESLLHDAQMVLNRLSPVEQEVASPTGRIYMRRVTPYRTLDNRIDGVVITFVDVTALKRAEELRSESEVRYRVITESARDFAIILMHADGRIEAWNTGAERILGWSEGEAVGKPGSLIYPDPDGQNVFAREMEAAVREGRAADETWHVRKGGERFWGSGVLSAFRAGGEITGFVKILRDETPRKLAEQERDRLLLTAQTGQRDAENINTVKDQFLARLSHEMRTPLSSILTWAEMLQHRELTDEQLHEGLRVIERSATAQKELLDDLLDTSRIASGKMRLSKTIVQPERLAQMAVEAMSLSAAERGVALELHAADSVGSILADPDRLRQVIANLIVNAVKFTPSGGRVDVRLERTDDHLELRVSDTGQGIAPEFLPHIFTPFSQADPTATRAYGGLGLGLAICRELVEMHGGTIRAESEGAGQGSTFIVRLPLPTQAQLEQTAVELEPIPHGNHDALRGVRILLIEDDHATQAAFARMLTGSGAEVATAGSAEEALAAFAASPPDVILSDIGLPVEDGYGLLKRVRELEQERGMQSTPAIALTAFAGPQHRRRAKEAGFQAHIAKPAKLATLISTIARYAKK
ncbi:MAG TPA: ATP-binding protein, partial [Lacipirellula sp.]